MGEETTEPDSTEGTGAQQAQDLDAETGAGADAEAGAEADVASKVDEEPAGDADQDEAAEDDAEDESVAADDDAEDESVAADEDAAPAEATPSAGAPLWEAIASAAMLRAQPQFDETVLDAWCGEGAAALPTAALVGPFGRVDAIDPDEAHIATARERAGEQLPQLHFEVADPAEWQTAGYDLVQCVLGLAACDTPDETARHLVSLAKPGGRVVIALWAHDAFASLDEHARAALAAESAPADEESAPLVPGTAGTLATLLHELGLTNVRAERVDRHAELDADLAWRLVVAARRVPLDGLDDETTERVRQRFVESLTGSDLEHVDVSTLIAVGRRPA